MRILAILTMAVAAVAAVAGTAYAGNGVVVSNGPPVGTPVVFPPFGGRAISVAAPNAARHATPKKHPTKPKKHKAPDPIAVKVTTGYDEQYRVSAWVPIRVTLHNRTAGTINGTVQIPTNDSNSNGPPMPYKSLYSMPVVISGGATKHLTLYLPGSAICCGGFDVVVSANGHTVGSGYDDAVTFGSNDFTAGVLVSDPADMAWVKHSQPDNVTEDVVRLTPSTFDAVPEALNNLDVIVLADGATSNLTQDQLQALESFVRNGGGLILTGGSSWQETLRSLPAPLVPGTLTGSKTLPNLSGLDRFARGTPPSGAAVASVLTHPQGTVLAQQGSLPLVVQSPLGSGMIVYIAVDPASSPLRSWKGTYDLATNLVLHAAAAQLARPATPQNGGGPFFGPFGPVDIGTELSNVPAAALPSIVLFIVLTLLYVVLLGPINYFVLRRLKRRELSWATIPAGALLCVGATFAIAFHLKGNTVLINDVGIVQLDDSKGPYPAALYLGLFAPVRGDYTLSYNGNALPSVVQRYDYWGGPQGNGSRPLGLRLSEGGNAQVQFVNMNMWSMRNVALHSSVNIPGGIKGHLHIDRKGFIVGAVENDTPLTFQHPVIIAGQHALRLPTMGPEKAVRVHLKPKVDIYNTNGQSIWFKVYGAPSQSTPVFAKGFFVVGSAINRGGPFCCQPTGLSLPPEKTMLDRIRNAASRIPEAQNLVAAGEIMFAGWSTQSIGSISVDGSTPQRRDLNLVVAPLHVTVPSGPFTFNTGTFGARLVDIAPAAGSNNPCCAMQDDHTVYIPGGGSATFQFNLPGAGRLHLTKLWLSVNAGGADGTNLGRAYDWRAQRWVKVNLANGYSLLNQPDRYIGPGGDLQIKLVPDLYGQDVRIPDPRQNIQISGSGVMR